MAFENAATLPMGKGLARNPPGGSREEERSVSCDSLEVARCQLLEAERSAAKQYWGLGGFRISLFLCPPEKLAAITTLYEQACKTRRNSCSTAAVARTEMDDGTNIRLHPPDVYLGTQVISGTGTCLGGVTKRRHSMLAIITNKEKYIRRL